MSQQVITSLSITNPASGTLTFDGSNFILNSIDGLDFPMMRLPRFNLPGQRGAFVSNQLYGERVIKIKGTVNAPDGSVLTYLTNRASITQTLSIATDNNGNLQPSTLTITLQNGQVLTSSVYLSKELSMGFPEDQIEWATFLLQLVAPDPGLYSTTQTSGTIALPVGGGAAIPTAIPINLAPASGGQVTLNNVGSLDVAPIITITAPIVNPYITNLRTGKYLNINYTLNVGDNSLVINCANQTIYQGTSNVTGIQTSDSTFWSIRPGSNTIGFSASSGSGTATVTFFPVFIGV